MKNELMQVIKDLELSIERMEKAGYNPLSKRMLLATNKLTEQRFLLKGLK